MSDRLPKNLMSKTAAERNARFVRLFLRVAKDDNVAYARQKGIIADVAEICTNVVKTAFPLGMSEESYQTYLSLPADNYQAADGHVRQVSLPSLLQESLRERLIADERMQRAIPDHDIREASCDGLAHKISEAYNASWNRRIVRQQRSTYQ